MFFDSHVHTSFSHDGKSSMEEQCNRAAKLGLFGISFTDHYDPILTGFDFSHIQSSVEQAEQLRERYSFKILRGVELGDSVGFNKEWDKCSQTIPFDVVLGSTHSKLTYHQMGFPQYNFLCINQFTDEEIRTFLTLYYKNVYALVQERDMDVLTHLTMPLKYLNGRFHRNMTLERQAEQIELILKEIIKRDIALEINTSGAETEWGQLMPDKELLTLYYSLGGRRITLGSDAHQTDFLGKGLEIGARTAKEVGFTHYCYYENRKPVEVAL